MSVPKFNEMYKPILDALVDGEVHKKSYIINCIADYYGLTYNDRIELTPSGDRPLLNSRVQFAITYLKKAGLLEQVERSTFRITNNGISTINGNMTIDDNYLKSIDSFIEFKNTRRKYTQLDLNVENIDVKDDSVKNELSICNCNIEASDTPDDILENVTSQLRHDLADELLDELMKLSPNAFEHLVLDLMRAMGYGIDAETTSQSRDNGIDGVIYGDKLGINLIYVQAKLWDRVQTVGRPEIQKFVGAIAGKDGKGIFITTSKFSSDAVEYARAQHIILIDGMKLADYMIEYNFGVTVKRTYEVKAVDSDTFADNQEL